MDGLDYETSEIGYARVDSQIACVLTRFNVRSVWALLRFYRAFRRVRADARHVSGLLATLFLIEDRRTCYTLSLWRDEGAILEFNGVVQAHVRAANRCFRDLRFGPLGPQLWSAQFRLWAVSPDNLRWDGFDWTAIARNPMYPSHPRESHAARVANSDV